jgi:IPT/TIG domain
MLIIRFGGCVAALCLLFVPDGHAQVATSTGYQLADVALDSAGGGTASVGFSAHVTLGLSGGQSISPNYRVALGIVETTRPEAALGPVFFASTPDFGPKAGGTPVTVTGLNFDKFGVGPSLTLNIGGQFATGVNVLSSTMLTATAPAGPMGPQPVTVTTSLGANTDADGFIFTPALRTTPFSQRTAEVTFRNYGPVGEPFWVFASLSQLTGNTKFGTLLIGVPFYQLLPLLFYPGPKGIHSITFEVPDDPILDGVTLYLQSLDITQFSPIQGQLTNSSTTSF